MIPSTSGFLEQDFETLEQPDKTYKIHIGNNMIRGFTDELDAVQQAIYKILNTERYQYIIYSWDYGIELDDLFGEPVSYVCPELKRQQNHDEGEGLAPISHVVTVMGMKEKPVDAHTNVTIGSGMQWPEIKRRQRYHYSF